MLCRTMLICVVVSSLATASRAVILNGPNPGAGEQEAHLSSGDSGGAVFLRQGDTWSLAGIRYSVDEFKSSDSDKPFCAALFDDGGPRVSRDRGRRACTPCRSSS